MRRGETGEGWHAARTASVLQRRGALILLAMVVAWGAVRYENFLAGPGANLLDVLLWGSVPGLVALAMTFAVLTGGIDLSVGALLALASVLAASLSGGGLLLAAGGAVLVTTMVGSLNGLLITKSRAEPYLVTLATAAAARGMVLAYTHGESARATPAPAFDALGRGRLSLFGLEIPYAVLLLFAAFGAGWFVLTYTRFGRWVYAVGADEEAARLMGLNVGRVKVGVYAVSGALAGLAGVIHASRLGAGGAFAAPGVELDALAAVIVGGTLLSGGVGGAGSTLVGVLFLAVVFNLFLLREGVSLTWHPVLRGAFLLAAAVVQSRLSRGRKVGAP